MGRGRGHALGVEEAAGVGPQLLGPRLPEVHPLRGGRRSVPGRGAGVKPNHETNAESTDTQWGEEGVLPWS